MSSTEKGALRGVVGEQDDVSLCADIASGEPADTEANAAQIAERRVMGAAATVCGTAGALALGSVPGAVLGAAALYATTREDASGKLARKVGAMYLQASDMAMDSGLHAMDQGMKKAAVLADVGRERLSREVQSSSLPAPVRAGVCAVLTTNSRSARHSAQMVEEARKIRSKYPNKVPVICERSPYSVDLPEIQKNKFIVSGDMFCGEFKYMVHKQLARNKMDPTQTVYIFVNGLAPKTNTPMSELYNSLASEDGFLYVKYGAENTLG